LLNFALFGGAASLSVSYLSVYFVQGILRLSSLALTFFEKDHLHMEPAQVPPRLFRLQDWAYTARHVGYQQSHRQSH
jgi:hypothetical protein